MQLRILGCSGGIGGSLRTTSMLLDHDVLIDAGTGVGDLTGEQAAGYDTGDSAAPTEYFVGKDSHETHRSPAVDEAKAVGREAGTE